MRVVSVLPGSNAMDFGFLPGDIVESINDRSLPRGLELTEFMGIYDAGAKLHFVVSRDNKLADLNGTYQPAMMKRVSPLFSTDTPAGRVDLVREGNTVRAMTRGVATFTLLISPDAFDFSTPITVIADGKRVFEGRVEKSLATLMKWAARDNDRTMLYGAEITVTLTQ
jgi:hypothetical protein